MPVTTWAAMRAGSMVPPISAWAAWKSSNP